MNTLYFNYVLEVCACGSINKAAQNLYISQSSLSNSIKRLEDELGYDIFARRNSGISLTPEGELFLECARIIKNEIAKAQNIPSVFESQKNLSVICNYSYLCMQSLILFKKQHPGKHTPDFFKETGLVQIWKDVMEQRYRLGICYCFSQRLPHHVEVALKYNLKIEILRQNIPVVAVISRDHPFANRSSVNTQSLCTQKLVCFEDFAYDDWLGVLGIPVTSNVLYVFDRSGLAEAVRQGEYMALMIQDPMQSKEMSDCVTLQITGLDDSLNIFLLRPQNYILSKIEKNFIGFMKARLKESYDTL